MSEVLEEKLSIILRELGIDKASDVLDSAQGGQMFENLYMDALLDPEAMDAKVETVVHYVREEAEAARQSASVFGVSDDLSPDEAQRLMAHPLPHWVERMTVSYLRSSGGKAARSGKSWDLLWPDRQADPNVVFTIKDLEDAPAARHLTLDDSRIRGLAMRLPPCAPGQPILRIAVTDVPADLSGYWSLWRIAIDRGGQSRWRIMPLFLHDDGRALAPAARHMWDQLLTASAVVQGRVAGPDAQAAYARCRDAAEIQGRAIYDELRRAHRDQLCRERKRGEYQFTARRRAIERIGLPAVRTHRLTQVEQEERDWRKRLEREAEVTPEMIPLLIVRLEADK